MAKHWYIVHAYSNFEHKVAESIREQAAIAGLQDSFEEILVPTEEVVEMRRGRRVIAVVSAFAGETDRLLAEALREHPEAALLHHAQGQAALRKGERQAAIAAFREASLSTSHFHS